MQNLSDRVNRLLTNGKVWVLIMMMIGSALVIGIIAIISVYKFQNSTYVYEGPVYKPNFHPYLQSLSMFVGQFLSLPIFYLMKRSNPSKYLEEQRKALSDGKKLNMNRLLLFIPAVFDLLTSTMQFFAFNFISASAYQMLKGGSILTTFIFSIIFLRQPILRRYLLGSIFALVGVIIVGLANTIFSQSSSSANASMEVFGYFLMIGSLVTNGLLFTFEQKLLNVYHIQPLEIVGFQGLFGFIMYAILVPILCHVPCSLGPGACVYSMQGQTYMEGWSVYWKQLGDNPFLLVLGIISILGIFVFNVAGVTVTKYINSLARAIASMTKSLFVWILGLIVTLTLGSVHPNLKWEKIQANVIILQTLGFLLMLIGNFVYNDIIKLPKRFTQNQESTKTDETGSNSQILENRLLNKQDKQ